MDFRYEVKSSTQGVTPGELISELLANLRNVTSLTPVLARSVDDNQKDIVALGEGQKAIREYLEGLEKRLDGLERIVLENAGIPQVEAD